MERPAEQLVVRQHERRACKLAALIRVAPAHAAAVEFSRSVGDGTGAVGVTIVDVSNGGVGVESPVFLPRGTGVVVVARVGAGGEAIELSARVQRVTMISREPRFYLGLAYAGSTEARAGTLGRLLDHAGPLQRAQEAR